MTSPTPTPLDPQLYQEMGDCPHCKRLRVFIMVDEYDNGRVGYCLGCEEKVFVPFTRVTAEAA